jgi:hypothetical protein
MNMVSPLKLFADDLHQFKLAYNQELGTELRDYFSNPENEYLWELTTHRQTITQALQHTESFPLRYLKDLPTEYGTIQSNQHMDVIDSKLIKIPIFKKTVEWVEQSFANAGAIQVEFGRIFASKLAAKKTVDLHTDEGKYFSYYDRFHFTVTAAKDNLFVIKDNPCILEEDTLYWVNNHAPHWLENRSNKDRINFIIDARLS